MKKLLLVAALTSIVSHGANATVFGNTENNYDNRNYGGSGGAGGAGGNATGVGVGVGISGASSSATGGAVVGSGNSNATGGSVRDSGNSNNLNANVNKMGQGQDQSQGQSQRSSNRNNNTNVSSAQNSNSNANSGNNSNTNVNVEGSTYHAARIPVATAYAPNNVPTATCMGSSSAGVQSAGLGISLGSSWTDTNCVLLEQIRTVAQVLGQQAVAQEMMLAVPAYKEAVERMAGNKKSAAAPAASVVQGIDTRKDISYTDPIIRSRLGLPPLAAK